MFNKLLYHIRIKALRKGVDGVVRKKSYISPDTASSCLLFRSTRCPDNGCLDRLKDDFPNVCFDQLWLDVEKGKHSVSGGVVVSESDILSKTFETSEFSEILNNNYDWLIDLTDDSSEIAELILKRVSAKMKLGWRVVGSYYPDVVMADVDSNDLFCKNLKLFFEILEGNDV